MCFVAGMFAVLMVNTSFIDLRNDALSFSGFFGNEKLEEGKKYFSAVHHDSVSVDVCRFYISDVVLYAGDMPVAEYSNKLIDLFDSTSSSLNLQFYGMSNVTEIRFKLGIDSTTNVAGVGSGDLDPTRGMYWTWQSGYINLKLEGTSRLCKSNRDKFQYHIGGYSAPVNSLRNVILKVEKDEGDFNVHVDVAQLLGHIDLAGVTHIMSPSAKSQELADHAVKMFSIK
jgi:hypothetical protein